MRLNPGLTCRFSALAGLLLSTMPALGQLSPSSRVSLVTLYPGNAVYSLWGHSAIHIEDPDLGIDISFNYGTFDFGHPVSFLARFAYGKLDYMLSLQDYRQWVDYSWYVQQRAVIVQHLDLSLAEKDSLYTFLMWNALPENRVYRYDFLYDNCATRIRDALERVLGEPLAGNEPSELTYRQMVTPYARQHSLVDLAMNLGMGQPADDIPTRRDRTFLPLDLAEIAAESVKPDGNLLVQRTDTLYGDPTPPSTRTSLPWTAGLLWLALIWGFVRTVMDFKNPRRRLTDLILFSVVGAAGLLLSFLGFISLHTVTWPNLHLMWAWPTHLAIIWVRSHWVRFYWWVSFLGATVFLAGLPFWTQGVQATIIPLALLLGVRSLALGLVPRTGFEPVLPA